MATQLLTLAHLVGLALAMGASTVKLVLLLRCRADPSFVPAYVRVAHLITREILAGMVLVTGSGIVWLFLGYPITTRLLVKLVLVASIWVMGPVIDKVAEPRFKELASTLGEEASPAFLGAWKTYLALEVTATLMFYVIVGLWVLG